MATDRSLSSLWLSQSAPPVGEKLDGRRDTIVMVRWALAIVCGYMMLFNDGATSAHGLGPLVIVVFLVSNLVVGRLPIELVSTSRFNLVIAVVDTLLIGTSLYLAGAASVELLILFLGILVLAIAGFQLGAIAACTLGMTAVSLLIVWALGNQPLLRTSMLVRVPFLLVAAVVYAWLADGARGEPSAEARSSSEVVTELTRNLSLQLEAVQRCQTALFGASATAAQSALNDIAQQNREMSAQVAALHLPIQEIRQPAVAARNAA